MPDQCVRCGRWPFYLPDDHPFYPACVKHDAAYDTVDWTVGTYDIDQQLLHDMEDIALSGDFTPDYAEFLLGRARLYYHLARSYGALVWFWKDKVRPQLIPSRGGRLVQRADLSCNNERSVMEREQLENLMEHGRGRLAQGGALMSERSVAAKIQSEEDKARLEEEFRKREREHAAQHVAREVTRLAEELLKTGNYLGSEGAIQAAEDFVLEAAKYHDSLVQKANIPA